MKSLNVKSMKKSFDEGMPMEDIRKIVTNMLEGACLVKVLDRFYADNPVGPPKTKLSLNQIAALYKNIQVTILKRA